MNFRGGSDDNESAWSTGDADLSPQWGRSSGEGNGYPFQYSCLENSMDRGVWWATVLGLQRVRHDWGDLAHMHAFNSCQLLNFCYSLPISRAFLVAQLWSVCLQCRRQRRHRFSTWLGKIPWSRAWQPTPVSLHGESPGQKSLVGYSPRVAKSRSRLKQLNTYAHTSFKLFLPWWPNFLFFSSNLKFY